jgi:hypothetical protein
VLPLANCETGCAADELLNGLLAWRLVCIIIVQIFTEGVYPVMQTGKIVKTLMMALLLILLVAPTAVFADFDGKGTDALSRIAAQQEGEGEEEHSAATCCWR